MKLIISFVLLITSLSLLNCYSDEEDKRIEKCVNLCVLIGVVTMNQCGTDTNCMNKARSDAANCSGYGCGAF